MDLKHLPDVHSRGNAEGVKNDIERLAVFKEGHILLRKNAGYNTLVSVAAGHLVADRDLSSGRYSSGRPCSPGLSSSPFSRVKSLYVNHNSALAWELSGRPRTSRAFSPKIALSSLSSAVSSVSPLGVTFADQYIAGANLGAHADCAALVEILQASSPTLGIRG